MRQMVWRGFPARINQIDGIVHGIGIGVQCRRQIWESRERILRKEAAYARIVEARTEIGHTRADVLLTGVVRIRL